MQRDAAGAQQVMLRQSYLYRVVAENIRHAVIDEILFALQQVFTVRAFQPIGQIIR